MPPNGPLMSASLTTSAPQTLVADAEELVRRHFGIAAAAQNLTSERDQNFHLRAEDGKEYVLKIANPAEDPQVTNFQTEALRHIAAANPALPVPHIIDTVDGSSELQLSLDSERTSVVRLLTYMRGEPLHRVRHTTQQRRNLGRCLGELDLALHGFTHPASGHDLLWDITYVGRLRGLIANVEGAERQALVERFLDGFDQHAQPILGSLRAQVIHNDLNLHNVLVDPADHDRVAGIIDFGDIVQAPLINDVAVAASYQLTDRDDPLHSACEFIAAYHAVMPLHPVEVDILFDLIAARLLTTVLITGWRAARYPDNRAYILRNNPPAWAGLEYFSRLSRSQAQSRLRRACGME